MVFKRIFRELNSRIYISTRIVSRYPTNWPVNCFDGSCFQVIKYNKYLYLDLFFTFTNNTSAEQTAISDGIYYLELISGINSR